MKAFRKDHKNDYRNAEAIEEAVQTADHELVAIKTPIYLPEVIQRLSEYLKYRRLILNFWPGGPTKCNAYEGLHQGGSHCSSTRTVTAGRSALAQGAPDSGRALGPGARRSGFPQDQGEGQPGIPPLTERMETFTATTAGGGW